MSFNNATEAREICSCEFVWHLDNTSGTLGRMRPGQPKYRSRISWMGDRFFCTPLRLYRFSFLCSLVPTRYGGLSP